MYENRDFLRYFRTATPIAEISRLQIGSRPASRKNSDRIEDLRAIPWVFSWMQSRHTLPGWFGLGYALDSFVHGQKPEARSQKPEASLHLHPANDEHLATLQAMYTGWPAFRTMIDNAQMILGKADMHIARRYADLVPEPAIANAIYTEIAAEHERAVRMVKQIAQLDQLLDNMPVLQTSIARRNPYVDPLSYIQVELLGRLRANPDGPEQADPGRRNSLEHQRDRGRAEEHWLASWGLEAGCGSVSHSACPTALATAYTRVCERLTLRGPRPSSAARSAARP